MTFNLIIFDCDGTLVNSEHAHNLAVAELLISEGFTHCDVDYIRDHFSGTRFSHILDKLGAETGHQFPDGFRQRYIERARALLPTHQKTIDGVHDLLTTAKAMSKICVASNGQRDNVFYSLEIAGLLPYFEERYIFTGLDVANAKPAPDLFLLAANKLGEHPNNALVIEDSVVGVRAGVAAGMMTYGFTGTHHSPQTHAQTLRALGADDVFNTLIHIDEHLRSKKPFSAKNK